MADGSPSVNSKRVLCKGDNNRKRRPKSAGKILPRMGKSAIDMHFNPHWPPKPPYIRALMSCDAIREWLGDESTGLLRLLRASPVGVGIGLEVVFGLTSLSQARGRTIFKKCYPGRQGVLRG